MHCLMALLQACLLLWWAKNCFAAEKTSPLEDLMLELSQAQPTCGRSSFHDVHKADPRFQEAGVSKRVVGGQESQESEWPWLVSLQLQDESGQSQHICGGTLIHPRWVVTAAHCFESIWADYLTTEPSAWKVRIGEHNMSIDEGTHDDITPTKIICHPRRNPPWHMNYDIAMVKLSRAVQFNERTEVACLPTAREVFRPGNICVTAGWGHTGEDGHMSDVVRHVTLPVLNNVFCGILYHRISDIVPIRVTGDMMCAGDVNGGRDACQFDSGGPMVCFDRGQERWVLRGVVMTGYGCARAGFPGIYTRVSSFTSWINRIIRLE